MYVSVRSSGSETTFGFALLIPIPQSVMSLWASGLDLIRLMNLSMVFARAW